MHAIRLPIGPFMDVSWKCPSASEVALNYIGKIEPNHTPAKTMGKRVYGSCDVLKGSLHGSLLWPLGTPGARPTKHISIEFEIRWKFKTL